MADPSQNAGAKQTANQSTNPADKQTANQTTNPADKQTANQTTSPAGKQTANQSTSPADKQTANQSASQAANPTAKPLAGKTAIITGANQGLGKVCAKAYLDAGAHLVMCARNEELLKAAYDELSATVDAETQRLNWLPTDVAKVADVERLVDFALEKNPRIDILVNNAGVYGPKGCIEDVDWEEWTRSVEINLYGPILMCRALLPHFKANKAGKIINMSGGGATAPLPRLSAYAAAKAALVRLTETMAHETLGLGIDVNAIAPGALNTRLLDEIISAGPDRVGKDFYERSLKQKEDGGASMSKAAELCVYLGADESDGITGKLISAVWDPWKDLARHLNKLKSSEIYTLRRIVPADRGEDWG